MSHVLMFGEIHKLDMLPSNGEGGGHTNVNDTT